MGSFVGLWNVVFAGIIAYLIYQATQQDLKFAIICFFLAYIAESLSDLYKSRRK